MPEPSDGATGQLCHTIMSSPSSSGAAATSISLAEEAPAQLQQPDSGTASPPPLEGSPGSAAPAPQAPSRLNAARRQAAAAALERFAAKLAGRDAELQSSRRAAGADAEALSVPEQVSALLRAAMSMDNLSRMYEGWTPWL
jgi:phosphatidylinositol kinase/protein kinase (PI-3  family)